MSHAISISRVRVIAARFLRAGLKDAVRPDPAHKECAKQTSAGLGRRLLRQKIISRPLQDSKWQTLHYAARDGRLEVVKVLLEQRANLEAKDEIVSLAPRLLNSPPPPPSLPPTLPPSLHPSVPPSIHPSLNPSLPPSLPPTLALSHASLPPSIPPHHPSPSVPPLSLRPSPLPPSLPSPSVPPSLPLS